MSPSTTDSFRRPGISINGSRNTVTGCVSRDTQETPTQRSGIEVPGDRNLIVGGSFTGNATQDIRVGGVENQFWGVTFDTITDNGTRTVVNGNGTNSGDPNTTGQWNGNASRAYDLGVTVWDTSTSPATPFKATPSGSWVQD